MKSKWVWRIVLVLIVAASGFYYAWSRREENTSYRESIVVRGDLATSILATGTVQPENRLEIKAPIAGRIERVMAEEGQKVRKGQILAWMSSTERAAMLDAARSKGREEVKRWEEMYQATPVLAPIDGRIILRGIEAGQTITTTDPVLVMSDRLTVKAQVDETDLAQIRLKQAAVIVLDAYPQQVIPAVVDQIAFEAKTVSNVTTYQVNVLPKQTPEVMRSGMTANVRFEIESRKDVVLAPVEAIRTDGAGGAVVLVTGPEGRPVERLIEIGLSDGKNTEIRSGLQAGDSVLIAAPRARAESGVNPFMPSRGGKKSSGRR